MTRVCLGGLVLLWVGLASYADGFGLPDNPYALDKTRACGPLCIAFLDNYFSNGRDYRAISALCPAGPQGTNLKQLRDAAQSLGYHTLAFEFDAKHLNRLAVPSILHCRRGQQRAGHFVVCLGPSADGESLLLFDPPNGLIARQTRNFTDELTGAGLAISTAPLSDPNDLYMAQASQLGTSILWLQLAVLLVLIALIVGRGMRHAIAKPVGRTVIVTLLLASGLMGCSDSEDASGEIGFIRDVDQRGVREVDLGEVLQGVDLEHVFKITNASAEPLTILRVERSCACQAVAAETDEPIAPGASTEIVVQVPTQAVEGQLKEHFRVVTDAEDPELASIRLTLRANIQVILKPIPSQILFGGNETLKTLRVVIGDDEVLKQFRSAEVDHPLVDVKLRDRQPGMLLFDVELDKACPPGDIAGQIALYFNHLVHKECVVPVIGRKSGDLRVIPTRIAVGRGGLGNTSKMRIKSNAGRAFNISAIDSPKDVAVEWPHTEMPQAEFDISVAVRELGMKPSGIITVHTDVPEQPSIKIPLVVME